MQNKEKSLIYNNSKDLYIKFKVNTKLNNIYLFLLKNNNIINMLNLGKKVKVINSNKLFFKDKASFYAFKSFLFNRFYEMIHGFFLELNLVGVGYNIYIYKNVLYIDLGYSHYLGLNIKEGLLIKRFKQRLIIFGYSKKIVVDFSKILISLRRLNIYKGKGFIYKGQVIKLKEGKKR